MLLPSLDRMTRSDWLVSAGFEWQQLGGLAAMGVVYVVLIVAAALFDFHRKNF
jgi:hypothetical protein